MKKMEKRVLLFDIDGTLLDLQGEGRRFMRQALLAVFGVAGPIDSYDMSGKTDWQIVTDLMCLAGVDSQVIEDNLEAAFAAYAREVARAVPGLQVRALPGMIALLDRLKNESVFQMGLLTGNVREAVPYKLRAAGIDPAIFRFGVFGSEHRDRNNLPFLALERLAKLQDAPVHPNSVLVIGDTPRDIDCARHAGMKVLSLATGLYDRDVLARHQPDYLLDDLTVIDTVMEIFNHF
jgi:phosphoglycolate phosphatase